MQPQRNAMNAHAGATSRGVASRHQAMSQGGANLLSDELDMLSGTVSVSVIDPAEFASQHKELCSAFSCLFCEHVSIGEVSLAIHLAEVHKCRSQFSCTECDYQCSVRELFSIHMSTHLCLPHEGSKGIQVQCSLTQQVIVKEEIPDGEYNETTNDVIAPPDAIKTLSKKRKRKRHSVNGQVEEPAISQVLPLSPGKDSGSNKTVSEENDEETGQKLQEESNSTASGHDSIPKSRKEAGQKFKSFQELVRALSDTPQVILDVTASSVSGCKEFSCLLCSYVTPKFEYFKEHFMKHINLTPFVCKHCSAGFVNLRRLIRHIDTVHAPEKTFQCDQCSYAATSKSCLRMHRLTKHASLEDLRFQCPDCPLKFAVHQQFVNHQRARHRVHKHFMCEMCNYSTNHSASLRSHMGRHLGLVYLCQICGNSYSSKYQLQRHERTHDENNLFYCDRCAYSCSHGDSLKKHYRVHTNERPYSCTLCSYRGKSKSALTNHMVRHTDCRKYECSRCNLIFKRKHHLERHQETHSSVVFKCSLCDYSGQTRASYERHMLLHDAGRRWNCSYCSKYFATPGELGHHTTKFHPDVSS